MRRKIRNNLWYPVFVAVMAMPASGCGPQQPQAAKGEPSPNADAAAETSHSGEQPPSDRLDMLVSVAELKQRLDDGNLRILDARPQEAYGRAHIPGAVHVDLDGWKDLALAKGGLRDQAAWSEKLGSLGIDARTNVVVYAENPTDATRVWWTLKYLGLENAAVLDGGWPLWQAEAGQTSSEAVKATPARFQPRFQPERLAELADLKASYRSDDVTIVDARSAEEYSGTAGPSERKGRIPGSVHLEWKELLDKKGCFKSKDELRALFQQRGIAVDSTAVTYCQSGGRASLDAFALERAGYRNVKNYYCSWQEWSADAEAPVEK